MKKLLKKTFILLSVFVMIFAFTSCDDDDNDSVQQKPTITVIMGKNGKGNNDYSALIYKAIDKWQKNPNVETTVYFPESHEEASRIYKAWAKNSINDVKTLMVLANGEYAYMAANEKLNLNKNQQVLAFEMDLKETMPQMHCFELSHSGISYLSGKLASVCKEAAVLIGHNTPMLESAADYFHKGFGMDKPYSCIEISESFSGFNMADKAKELAKKYSNSFILPLAGLSNNGVYEFLNECKDGDVTMAAGMDVDCSALSKRIPFSYIVNIDKAIDLHLQCWYDNKPWPDHKLGLKDGMMSILFNPDFTQVGNITNKDFEKLYNMYLHEAEGMDK